MQNSAQIGITPYITYLSFQLLRNGTSKYFICFLTNNLLRSEGFTEQSFAMENKFLFLFNFYFNF